MPEDGGPYRLYKTYAISEVTQVRVYDETLPKIAEHRMELPCFTNQLENGLIRPTHIYLDNQGRNAYVFVSVRDTYNGDPIHLPVVMVDGTSGRLATAIFTDNEYKGTLVWSANDV